MHACIPQHYSLLPPTSTTTLRPLSPPIKSNPLEINNITTNPIQSNHLEITNITTTTISTMSRLPEDQLKQFQEIFNRFDLDKDGSLTHLEVAALLRSLGLKPSGDQIHKLFNHMDSDGSGTVEFDELVNAMSSQMMTEDILMNQHQLLEIFKSFDRDGSGFITPAELAKSMTKMGQPLTYRELTEMVRDADTDGDGVISFTEFQRIMARSAADSLGFSL
ncbi:putative EF-hand domain-containing protein [Helianthus annuus]|nr:putative EF-hand domain-containing protein [Helianthus annuus]KAJ0680351.1 putative EF-hand domain-containing protein [Helianthus annuus]KAJ0834150.1 putative EF-hand domain-containing protein [Helianthus annuus]